MPQHRIDLKLFLGKLAHLLEHFEDAAGAFCIVDFICEQGKEGCDRSEEEGRAFEEEYIPDPGHRLDW